VTDHGDVVLSCVEPAYILGEAMRRETTGIYRILAASERAYLRLLLRSKCKMCQTLASGRAVPCINRRPHSG